MAKQERIGKTYTSPYSQSNQRYPSQSEEFISWRNGTTQRKECAQQGEYGRNSNYGGQQRRWSSPCKRNANNHFRRVG